MSDFQPLEQSKYIEPLEINAATQDDENVTEVENVQVISQSPVYQITDDLISVKPDDDYNSLPDVTVPNSDLVSNMLASAAEVPSYQPVDELHDHGRDDADNQNNMQEENQDDEGDDYADDEHNYSNENEMEDSSDNAEHGEMAANSNHSDSDESDIVYLD